MKIKIYDIVDKSKWEEGKWNDEPDFYMWVHKKTDLICLVIRSDITGSLLGYVALEKDSRHFGKEVEHFKDIEVHGEVTVSEKYLGNHIFKAYLNMHLLGNMYFVGFDSAHHGDFLPALSQMKDYKEFSSLFKPFGNIPNYKDIGFMKKECEKLASQLID